MRLSGYTSYLRIKILQTLWNVCSSRIESTRMIRNAWRKKVADALWLTTGYQPILWLIDSVVCERNKGVLFFVQPIFFYVFESHFFSQPEDASLFLLLRLEF